MYEKTAKDFWDSLDKTGDCWLWTGNTNAEGYGATGYHGKAWGTHRLAWYLTNGEIPAGMLVCHKCDCPPCCNPDHLFIGSYKDNVSDSQNKGRRPVKQITHKEGNKANHGGKRDGSGRPQQPGYKMMPSPSVRVLNADEEAAIELLTPRERAMAMIAYALLKDN